jgi:hypothetical protein
LFHPLRSGRWWLGRWPIIQDVKIPPFGGVEAQGVGQCREHLGGRPNIATLLQPRVPGRSNAREQGNFLAPQAWCAAPESIR